MVLSETETESVDNQLHSPAISCRIKKEPRSKWGRTASRKHVLTSSTAHDGCFEDGAPSLHSNPLLSQIHPSPQTPQCAQSKSKNTSKSALPTLSPPFIPAKPPLPRDPTNSQSPPSLHPLPHQMNTSSPSTPPPRTSLISFKSGGNTNTSRPSLGSPAPNSPAPSSPLPQPSPLQHSTPATASSAPPKAAMRRTSAAQKNACAPSHPDGASSTPQA